MAQIEMIPVSQLWPHPDNPRKDIGDVSELSHSIKAKGILQNLTVVPGHPMTDEEWHETWLQYKENPSEELREIMNRKKWRPDGYTVIIGHRRLQAAKEAGLSEVPCVVSSMTESEQFETMMVENVQRADLTIYEQAEGFQMMLDLGGSVATVSEKTGFSQSTVRSRVKLMQLDKAEFKKAEARGGTLQDYAELSKIDDLDEKNKLLKEIGTPNFRMALKKAQDEQAVNHQISEWVKLFTPFAKEIKKADHQKMDRVYYIDKWTKGKAKAFTVPEDVDTEEYFYIVSKGYGVDLYKSRSERVVRKADEARRKAAELQRRSDAIEAELEELTDTCYDLRQEFIQEYNPTKADVEKVIIFAIQALFQSDKYYGTNRMHHEVISDLTDVPMDSEDKNLDPQEFALFIRENPARALMATAYALLDGETEKYWTYVWEGSYRKFKHTLNERLDVVYQLLISLGYEMSDEEKALRDGTHEIFQRTLE